MTAEHWAERWVARQLARLDGASGQIRLASLALTAFSTFSIMLQGFGLGDLVPVAGLAGAVLGGLYVYWYTERDVWNQMARDRQDYSGDWAGPNGLIQAKMTARILAATEKGEPLSDAERDAAETEGKMVFDEHRDGVLD
jgi:hypothetical protein